MAGHLLLSQPKLGDQTLVGFSLFHGVEIFPLNILHQRHFKQLFFGKIFYNAGNVSIPRQLCGSKTPFAGNKLVAILESPYKQWLNNSLLFDGSAECSQFLLIKFFSRLIPVGTNAAHPAVNVIPFRLLCRSDIRDKRSQPFTELPTLAIHLTEQINIVGLFRFDVNTHINTTDTRLLVGFEIER